MENSTRNLLLALGIGIAVIGIILFYLEIINWIFLAVLIITGFVLVIIGVYNWGSGTDFSQHQETPIENVDIEFKREY